MCPQVPDVFPDFQAILPGGAVASALAMHEAEPDPLHNRFSGIAIPEALTAAIPRRRLQYAAGRHCARLAMSQLGLPDSPVGRDAQNVPVWPAGIIGSISHTDDVTWAAAAFRAETSALGIDVERLGAATRARAIEHLVCSPGELALAADAGMDRAEFLIVAFSLKESLFKCVFPLARIFFGYRDATITGVHPGRGSIDARLDTTVGPAFPADMAFTGRFAVSTTHVFTSVSLEYSSFEG